MLKNSKDKMQREDHVKEDLPPFEYFHFAGNGTIPPVTLRARTQADANEQYRRIGLEKVEEPLK